MNGHLDALFEGRPARLSPGDVAEILGMDKKTVYRYVTLGVVPAYKIGDRWLILRDELKEVLEKGRNLPGGEGDNEE